MWLTIACLLNMVLYNQAAQQLTRTSEGSLAYCSLLSVIETCRLRKVDPWSYIAQVIAQGRKGILPSRLNAPLEVAAL